MTAPIPTPPEASAAEVLRKLEWSIEVKAGWQTRHLCPICGHTLSEGHAPDCRLDAALKAATSSPDADEIARLRSARRTADADKDYWVNLAHSISEEAETQRERATAVESRVKALEEALRPFAEMAAGLEGKNWLDEMDPISPTPWNGDRETHASIGDLRRAHAALARHDQEQI